MRQLLSAIFLGLVLGAMMMGLYFYLIVEPETMTVEIEPMVPERTCTLFDAYDEDYKMYLGVLKLCGPLGADKPKQMLEGQPQGIWQ